MAHLTVEWRGALHRVAVDEKATLQQIGTAVAQATNTSFESLKLLLQGGKLVVPSSSPQQSAAEAGLRLGSCVRLQASTAQEVAAVRSSRDLPGLPSFEHEARRSAARRRRGGASQATLPTGPYTFGAYAPWDAPAEAFPSPAHGLKLLHRLAADRGIVAVMAKHKWRVGTLSEMPPEGKVGVSPVCVLGVNINAGQEISLRLRTDDLKGFRRYDRIRETLVHELAHMVWGEHDASFKALNSQLLLEATQLDWVAQPGHTVGGWAASDDEDSFLEAAAPEPQAHRLGGASDSGAVPASAPAPAAAAAAALRRAEAARARAAEAAAAAAVAGAAGDGNGDAIAGLGHRDRQTEAAEEAAARLAGMSVEAPRSSEAPASSSEAAAAADAAMPLAHESWPGSSIAQLPATGLPPAELLAAQPMDMDENPAVAGPADAAAVPQQQPGVPPASTSTSLREDPSSPAAKPSSTEDPGLESSGGKPAASSQPPAQDGQAAAAAEALRPHQAGGEVMAAPEAAPEAAGEVAQRYQRVQRAVAALLARTPTPQQAQPALISLQTILQNALSSSDPKFRRVRQNNTAFQSRLGRYPEALEVLHMAGFEEEQDPEPALALKRDDPGLIWLALSAVRECAAR